MPKINRGGKRSAARIYIPTISSKPIMDKAPDGSGTQKIGSIRKALLDRVFPSATTTAVIVRDESIQHVKEHHPDVYDVFKREIRNVIKQPDEIIQETANRGTLYFVKDIESIGYRAVVRVNLAADNKPDYSNSVITFHQIGSDPKKLKRLETRNGNKVVYRRRRK